MRKLLAAVLAVTLAAGPAAATPWNVLGPRALGLGGAYTGIAEGPVGAYWNPGGLGQTGNPNGGQILAGGRGDFTGSVLEGANDMHAVAQDCKKGPLVGLCTQDNITRALDKFNQPGNGALGDVGGGLNLKFGRLALFANSFLNIGATPSASFAFNAPGNFVQNTSKLVLYGASFTELGLGYGREIPGTGVNLGANLKGIRGTTGYGEITATETDSGGSQALDNYKKNTRDSIQPGVDVGLLWDVRRAFPGAWWRPRLGVVGRNVNNPRFKHPDAAIAAGKPAKYSLEGQARAGAALSPLNFWHVAADVDLTENLTPLTGFKSRQLSLGTEVNLFNQSWFNIPLRAGVTKNLAGDTAPTWTAGVGLNLIHLIVEVSGAVSNRKTRIQSQGKTESVPNSFAGAVSVSLLFGGREYEPPKDKSTELD